MRAAGGTACADPSLRRDHQGISALTATPDLTRSVAIGLQGALLLARGRPQGMYFFDGSPTETTRSFWAAAVCWPMFFILGLITGNAEGPGVWLVEGVGFIIGWCGFALASRYMVKLAGREAKWPAFIAAWNWSNIPQYAALVLLSAPGVLLPSGVMQGLALIAVGYALWLEWFVTREALGIPGASAVMFVLLDVAIGLFVQGMVGRLTM